MVSCGAPVTVSETVIGTVLLAPGALTLIVPPNVPGPGPPD